MNTVASVAPLTIEHWPQVEGIYAAGVVEHSVYVAPAAQGRGVGRLLLQTLIVTTETAGIWTIQSGVFPENVASLRLHVAVGFEVVGIRRRLGKMTYGPLAGQWRDVILIERRSRTVGTC